MSERIYAAIPEHFILRMRNWALASAGGGVYSSSSAFSMLRGGGYGSSTMPVLIGEAEDTGRALDAVKLRYRRAVMLFWQFEGRPLSWHARRCGDGVDYRTFESRVMRGHELLTIELKRQHEEIQTYREQVMKNLKLSA